MTSRLVAYIGFFLQARLYKSVLSCPCCCVNHLSLLVMVFEVDDGDVKCYGSVVFISYIVIQNIKDTVIWFIGNQILYFSVKLKLLFYVFCIFLALVKKWLSFSYLNQL